MNPPLKILFKKPLSLRVFGNWILRIGVSVGDTNDRQIGNSAYNKNRLYTDLQKNLCGYY